MKVLITGNAGMIGAVVTRRLQEAGYEVLDFDIVNGQDVRNPPHIQNAIDGCDAVVHLAALLGHEEDAAHDIMQVNLLGTWNVLQAAQAANVQRVLYFSSVEVLGIFKGERKPDYLPLDDNHPCYPASPYAISKRLSEEMCGYFTDSTGIPTICLRLPGVFDVETYAFIIENRRANPEFEWSPYWQYGAFLDVRDVAEAVCCALRCPDPGHVTLLLCADDISSASLTSRELAATIHPDVEWRGGEEYEQDPFKALLNTQCAREILQWKPRYKWRP